LLHSSTLLCPNPLEIITTYQSAARMLEEASASSLILKDFILPNPDAEAVVTQEIAEMKQSRAAKIAAHRKKLLIAISIGVIGLGAYYLRTRKGAPPA
jgi:hypothetical protein